MSCGLLLVRAVRSLVKGNEQRGLNSYPSYCEVYYLRPVILYLYGEYGTIMWLTILGHALNGLCLGPRHQWLLHRGRPGNRSRQCSFQAGNDPQTHSSSIWVTSQACVAWAAAPATSVKLPCFLPLGNMRAQGGTAAFK